MIVKSMIVNVYSTGHWCRRKKKFHDIDQQITPTEKSVRGLMQDFQSQNRTQYRCQARTTTFLCHRFSGQSS